MFTYFSSRPEHYRDLAFYSSGVTEMVSLVMGVHFLFTNNYLILIFRGFKKFIEVLHLFKRDVMYIT
jgi:hypothetical protein